MLFKIVQENKWLQWMLIVLVVISLFCFITLATCYLWKNFVSSSSSLISDVVLILNSLILLITAVIALCTYRTNRKIENIKGLIELRKLLSTSNNMRIHKYIGNNGVKERESSERLADNNNQTDFLQQETLYDIYNYLGTLELSKTFLDCQIIEKNVFSRQFGYRFSNIVNNETLLKILECEQQEESTWSDLFQLLKEFVPGYSFPSAIKAQAI